MIVCIMDPYAKGRRPVKNLTRLKLQSNDRHEQRCRECGKPS